MPNIVEVDLDLMDLIPEMLDEVALCLKEMDVASEDKNLEVLAKVSHKLVGSTGGYGFSFLAQVSKEMETAAKAGQLGVAIEKLTIFKDYFADIEIKYVEVDD